MGSGAPPGIAHGAEFRIGLTGKRGGASEGMSGGEAPALINMVKEAPHYILDESAESLRLRCALNSAYRFHCLFLQGPPSLNH